MLIASFAGEWNCPWTRMGESEQTLRLQCKGSSYSSSVLLLLIIILIVSGSPHYFGVSDYSLKHLHSVISSRMTLVGTVSSILQAPGHTKDVSRMRSILLQVLTKPITINFVSLSNYISFQLKQSPPTTRE